MFFSKCEFFLMASVTVVLYLRVWIIFHPLLPTFLCRIWWK